MTKWIWAAAAAVAVAGATVAAPAAEPEIGAAATNFRAYDMNGEVVELRDFRGKMVVLEWNNPGCPFVQKHYNSGNMQRTQRAATQQGAVWLTINSGAPGLQGHMNGEQAQAFVEGANAAPTHYLLDPNGVIGRGYDARTTPQMVIIDGEGRVRYNGAIDDKPTSNVADIEGARNHVVEALSEMREGRPVSIAETRPYGCSVKYAS